jgi:hypothetical protein
VKIFRFIPASRSHGVLIDNDTITKAIFLNPREAKFMASFCGVREAQVKGVSR